jgi:hypothetical protein
VSGLVKLFIFAVFEGAISSFKGSTGICMENSLSLGSLKQWRQTYKSSGKCIQTLQSQIYQYFFRKAIVDTTIEHNSHGAQSYWIINYFTSFSSECDHF